MHINHAAVMILKNRIGPFNTRNVLFIFRCSHNIFKKHQNCSLTKITKTTFVAINTQVRTDQYLNTSKSKLTIRSLIRFTKTRVYRLVEIEN